jgi:hypothetical protein
VGLRLFPSDAAPSDHQRRACWTSNAQYASLGVSIAAETSSEDDDGTGTPPLDHHAAQELSSDADASQDPYISDERHSQVASGLGLGWWILHSGLMSK